MSGLTFRPTRRAVLAASAALLVVRPTLSIAAAEDVIAASPRKFALPDKRFAYGVGLSDGFGAPLLIFQQGQNRVLRVKNTLDEPLRFVPVGIRGERYASTPLIAPQATGEMQFSCPDEGIFSYRFETEDSGSSLAAQGLCGPLLVRNTDSAQAVLALCNALIRYAPLPRLSTHKQIDFARHRQTMTYVHNPMKRVGPRSTLHLHIVNLSVDSAVAVRATGAQVKVVAVDGQPCPAFQPAAGRIVLPPSGRVSVRAEILNQSLHIVDEIDRDNPLMSFEFNEHYPVLSAPSPPESNPALPGPIPLEQAVRGHFTLGRIPKAEQQITAREGESVALAFENISTVPYSVHIQGHSARLIDALDDGWKPWWHDSVFVPAGDTTRLVLKAGASGIYRIAAKALDDVPTPDLNAFLKVR